MPELPEVETTVLGLRKKVLSRTFVDVWTDFEKLIKKPSFKEFKKEIKGKEIKAIYREGKNIIFELSGGYSLLVHQKLTGHLLYGKWKQKGGKWQAETDHALKEDRMNSYLHLIFFLDNGKMLALSDLRKFAKIQLWKKEKLAKELNSLGPDALKVSFSEFREIIKSKKGKIKQVLMEQEVIAGIGNIYSDEALWRAKIHPFRVASGLTKEEIKALYKSIREVLKKGIEMGGESISDYRNLEGEKGGFDGFRKVYRREGEKCLRCGTIIQRKKIGGRSTHFCPKCQRL